MPGQARPVFYLFSLFPGGLTNLLAGRFWFTPAEFCQYRDFGLSINHVGKEHLADSTGRNGFLFILAARVAGTRR